MLKEEVQLELIKINRLDDINKFIEMAVKYNNKLYKIRLK